MLHVRAGQRLTLAILEAATASLPVVDATGEPWRVDECTASIGDLELPTSIDEGVPSAAIPPLSSLGAHVLRWQLTGSDATVREYATQLEVVGAHLCSLADIRSYNKGADTDGFDDRVRYPDEVVFDARQRATDTIERATGRAFSSRIAHQVVYGTSPFVVLDHPDVHIVESDKGRARLLSDCQCLVNGIGLHDLPYTLRLTYGTTWTPDEVRAAVIKLAATYLRPLNRPEAATGESTDVGYISYTLAGRDGATGIPEVDAVIQRWARRRLGVM